MVGVRSRGHPRGAETGSGYVSIIAECPRPPRARSSRKRRVCSGNAFPQFVGAAERFRCATDEPDARRLLVLRWRRTSGIQSEDSAEGDRPFGRETDHDSGREPIRHRSEGALALRCWQELTGIVKRNRSGAKRRWNGLARMGVWGKGQQSLAPPSTGEILTGSRYGEAISYATTEIENQDFSRLAGRSSCR